MYVSEGGGGGGGGGLGGGQAMSVLPKIWRASFSCCLHFEICPFSLLTTILVFKLELFCLALICSKVFDFDKVVC